MRAINPANARRARGRILLRDRVMGVDGSDRWCGVWRPGCQLTHDPSLRFGASGGVSVCAFTVPSVGRCALRLALPPPLALCSRATAWARVSHSSR